MSNTQSPPPADLIELGRVMGAYGVRGWVKVQPHSADAGVLRNVPAWWLARPAAPGAAADPARAVAQEVIQCRSQGATLVAQLQGVADREQAEAMRGMSVMAPRSAFPAPRNDEYYWVDLVGCSIYGEQDGASQLIGIVDSVVDNGAHAVLCVLRQDPAQPGAGPLLDAKGRPTEVLVPFVAAHIRSVDLTARRIDSDWPLDF